MKPIRTVSQRAVEMVASFEGGASADGKFRPYPDPVGVWTIGYGHTTGLVKALRGRTPPWSAAKAKRVLRRQLDREYAPHVAALRLPLTQPMFDALVSFIYNVGVGGIASSTGVGRELRARHWHRAADHLLEWDKAGGRVLPGLSARRRNERLLFLSGIPRT